MHRIGTPLDVILQERQGGLSWNEALALFEQVLSTLDHAHQNGVIHRDVQPAHVMVCEGRVEVTGFAVGTAGNPLYMSPEQLRSAEIDARSNIYSAAVLFYEMLAGRPPFQGETDLDLIQAHLGQAPPDLKTLVPDLPAGVGAAVAIALHKDPQQRFPTAEGFLRALHEGVAGFLPAVPEPAPSPTPPASFAPPEELPVPPPGRPRRLVAASWVLLGLGLLGSYGLWKAWYQPPLPPRPHPGVVHPAPSPPPVETPEEDTRPSPDPEDPVSSKTEPVVEPPPERKTAALPPATPVVDVPDPEEVRRQEVERLREELQQGIQQAEADLRAQKIEATQEQLDRLMSQAQSHPGDLAEEIGKIRGLRKELTDAVIAAQEWKRRLQQIEKLMKQEKYPEADNLASDLGSEPGVPEEVAARARELSEQAKEELRKIWGDTQVGPTRNKVRKPPNDRERKIEP